MITEKSIDAYLDAQGVANKYELALSKDYIDIVSGEYVVAEAVNVESDAHVMAASREMLKDWIRTAYRITKWHGLGKPNQCIDFTFVLAVKNIESALHGRRWGDIKKELERMEVGG